MFKWGYLFGTIEAEGSGSEFLYTNGLGKEADAFLLAGLVPVDDHVLGGTTGRNEVEFAVAI